MIGLRNFGTRRYSNFVDLPQNRPICRRRNASFVRIPSPELAPGRGSNSRPARRGRFFRSSCGPTSLSILLWVMVVYKTDFAVAFMIGRFSDWDTRIFSRFGKVRRAEGIDGGSGIIGDY